MTDGTFTLWDFDTKTDAFVPLIAAMQVPVTTAGTYLSVTVNPRLLCPCASQTE